MGIFAAAAAADGSCMNAGLALVCTIVVGAIAFLLAGAVDDSKF